MVTHPATLNVAEHKKRDKWATTFDFLKTGTDLAIPKSPFSAVSRGPPRIVHAAPPPLATGAAQKTPI